MLFAIALLLGSYVGLALGVLVLFQAVPSWWPYWTAVTVALAATAFAHYWSAERLLLESVGAKIVSGEHQRELPGLHERLATLAELPTPQLGLAAAETANAFAVGLTEHRSVVVVTTALVEKLTPREAEALLAHELAHIANRDAVVMTGVSAPRTLGRLLVVGEGPAAISGG